MSHTLKLNCDLGESFGSWKMGLDEIVMPHIQMANIACGFHAGDPDIMMQTLRLAKLHKTEVGAHPSYPDLQGFGRRAMNCTADEITNMVVYQVSALIGMAKTQGIAVDYVKPHGAMYNDMMRNDSVRRAIYQAIALLNTAGAKLKLLLLASKHNNDYSKEAELFNVELIFESFADRRYTDEGVLQARTEKGSVLDKDAMLQQVENLINGFVTTASGNKLIVQSDTICVHGDNQDGVALIADIRRLCCGDA
jgi:5-oxoprolinase (ATP-hydrolysing) subunit A